MNKFYVKKNRGNFFKLLLLGASCFGYSGFCSAESVQEVQTVVVSQLQLSPSKSSSNNVDSRLANFSKNRYIVKLREPAVSTYLTSSVKMVKKAGITSSATRSAALTSSVAKKYQKTLLVNQNVFSAKMRREAPSVVIKKTYHSLLNGFSVTISEDELAKLKSMPEVEAVYPDHLRYAHLDISHQVIGTSGAWQYLGGQSDAGKGMKIAIIDSGIRNDNPMFFDQGFEPIDFSDNTYLQDNPDYCRSEGGDPDFCNNKIVLARWMDPIEHELFGVDSGEHMNPLGFNRHGSHVAGIAAGNEVSVEFKGVPVNLVGVSPGSYLMIYKALYSSGGSTFGSDSMLLEALEHAVNDGADVINNSWGSFRGESAESSVYADVFANAEAMGITVVTSAGNNGDSQTGSINCPGCIESGITVANTSHGRFFSHELTIAGASYIAVQGENDHLAENLDLTLRSFSELGVSLSDGCDYPFDAPLFDNVAVLVDYNDKCSLVDVSENVALAGGNAVVVYQNGVSDADARGPFEPHTGDYVIPVLGVTRATGLEFFKLASEGNNSLTIEADITLNIDPLFTDTLNGSSATGPNVNTNVLKPDLGAPGTNILSASAPKEVIGLGPLDPLDPFDPFNPNPGGEIDDSPVFEMISGTSMSAPHVTGAAALLKQAYPDWSPKQIKSALTSTANKHVLFGSQLATPFAIGAGRLDLAAAINAKLSFEQVSFANGACVGACYFSTSITNLTAQEKTWQATLSFDNEAVLANLNDDEFTFSAHGQDGDSIDIALDINTTLVEPGIWVFGELILTHSEHASQRLPLAIYANDNSDINILSTSVDLSNIDGELPFTASIRNYDLAAESSLSITIPNNVAFVQGSENVEILRGNTDSFEFDSETSQLNWRGSVLPGEMQLNVEESWGNTSLASLGITPVSCSQGCGNFSALVDFTFRYHGEQYSSLAISSNGFVVPGSTPIDPLNVVNTQNFPQQNETNNIIAPLWASYDLLDDTNELDSGGGYLRTSIRTIDGVNFLVVEWDSVQLFGSDTDDESGGEENATPDQFSFQLIIEENTDNIWFNYLSIPSMPYTASIGAEGKYGLVGIEHYFIGEGTPLPAPISTQAYTLRLSTLETGEANIGFSVVLSDNQNFTAPDKVQVTEDTSIEIDVLENDYRAVSVKVDLTLEADNTYHASRLVKVKSQTVVDSLTLEVTQEPEFGSVSMTNDKLLYQPNDNYSGDDIFAYKVADESGLFSGSTLVEVTVVGVNDKPELTVSGVQTIKEGDEVTLTANATDVDSDELEYIWVQTAGVIVPFTQMDNTINFIAPNVSGDSLMSFDVKVSDGDTTSATVSSSVTVVNRDGGALWLSVFLLIGLLFYRQVVVWLNIEHQKSLQPQ